jgi:uncharacterized iron-regulated membrane protein
VSIRIYWNDTVTKLILRRVAQWLHKWLALIVGIQVLAWVLGGALFALLPFDAWVKSGDVVRKAPKATIETVLVPLTDIAYRFRPQRSIELIGQGKDLYYRLSDANGTQSLVNAVDGKALPRPDENLIRKLATDIYLGDVPMRSVQLIEQAPPAKLFIVNELNFKSDVWQVNFADRINTRFYFNAQSGEFLRARNDAWVLYDFFWRLHIMDYSGGEDFNNKLLRVLSPLALVLVLSGGVLLFFSRFRKSGKSKIKKLTAPLSS